MYQTFFIFYKVLQRNTFGKLYAIEYNVLFNTKSFTIHNIYSGTLRDSSQYFAIENTNGIGHSNHYYVYVVSGDIEFEAEILSTITLKVMSPFTVRMTIK